LATFFAKQGDATAKQAIYKCFYKKIINGSDWCGYDSIIALDGIEGLKFIASTIGKALEKKPDNWQDDMIIEHFQGEYPSINVTKELNEASKEIKYIKIYLDKIKRTEANRDNFQRPVFNLETLRERIANSKYIFIPPALRRRIINFTNQKSKGNVESYLTLFTLIAQNDKVIGKMTRL
jgi:hypothetical protein